MRIFCHTHHYPTHRPNPSPVRYLLLLLILLGAGLRAQAPRNVTLTGKVHRSPDTILLLKHYENPSYEGIKIAVRPDSTFDYTLAENTVEEYVMIFMSDYRRNGYRQVPFFTDADTLHFTLYPQARMDQNRIEGSRYTELSAAYRDSMTARWYPEVMAFEEKIREGMDPATEKAMADSLVAEMFKWSEPALAGYPAEVALSIYYRDLEDYRPNNWLRPLLAERQSYWTNQARVNTTSDRIKELYAAKLNGIVGQPFQDFYLYTEPSDSVLLSAVQANARYILLDLWSPWCEPCIRKSRKLAEYLPAIEANGVSVIGVMGGIPTEEKYRQGMAQFTYDWPVYPEIDRKQSIWGKYGLERAGGGQFLIDTDGTILAVDPSIEEVLGRTGIR